MATAADNKENFTWDGFGQVQELTRRNQELVHALDAKERECAELSAALETGGDRLAAGVRESKIVEMARKNRSLTLAVEKEKAEKARLVTELKAARAGTGRAPGVLHAGAPNEDGTPRTESQIEKACREVVAEAAKAAEDASKERAEWKEKAREASARAERDAGRYHTVRAENDRLRAIIKREVGDDKVDFSKLEKSLEAAGGWRGRAREIATLRHKVQRLRDRLELYEDGEQLSVTSTASRFATTGPFGDLPDADLNEGGFEPGSRPGTAATDVSRRTARSFAGASRETAREASARRRQLEEATAALAASEAACEDARAKAKAAGVRKDALERDVRGLREKLDVLKEKSKHDDRLIDALRAENRRARGEAEEALLRETMTSADFRSGGAGSSRQRGGVAGFQNFAGGSVPVSVYKALERRAEHADAQLRESEQRVLQLRAKIASLENDAAERPKGDGTLRDSSRASIAAAAADLTDDTDLPDVSRQHQDDVAALIEHAEALERETEGLRGRLAVAEKTERALRARLGEAQHETRELKTRLETGAGTGPAAKSAVPAESAGYEGKTNSVDDEDVVSLRARLASAEAELERVRRASREQIESMEKEVELYFEMAEEMKRTMRDGGAC